MRGRGAREGRVPGEGSYGLFTHEADLSKKEEKREIKS